MSTPPRRCAFVIFKKTAGELSVIGSVFNDDHHRHHSGKVSLRPASLQTETCDRCLDGRDQVTLKLCFRSVHWDVDAIETPFTIKTILRNKLVSSREAHTKLKNAHCIASTNVCAMGYGFLVLGTLFKVNLARVPLFDTKPASTHE